MGRYGRKSWNDDARLETVKRQITHTLMNQRKACPVECAYGFHRFDYRDFLIKMMELDAHLPDWYLLFKTVL
jgi:hypothetical protein